MNPRRSCRLTLLAVAGVGVFAAGVAVPSVAGATGTTTGTVTEYPVTTASAGPYGITAGPDGNLWFAEASGNNLGRITPGGTVTEFPLGTASADPLGVATGPDGNLWVTEYIGNKIARVTPGGSIVWEYSIPTASAHPMGITAGPDGNVWFAEYGANKIGKITPGGAVTEYPIPTPYGGPRSITAGPDGNLCVHRVHRQDREDHPGAGTSPNTPSPRPSHYPRGSRLELTETCGSPNPAETRSGRSPRAAPSPSTHSPLPTQARLGIAAGSDGNVWFTEQKSGANKIGRITPSGTITEYTLPTASAGPTGITAGPDGNLWFTEYSANKIGTLALANTAVQSDSVTVPAGTLSIALAQTSVAFGTVGGGASAGRSPPARSPSSTPSATGWPGRPVSPLRTCLTVPTSSPPVVSPWQPQGYRRQPGPAPPRPQEAAERSASPGATASATWFTVCPTPARNRC